jgi:bile acid:Na+ symporter, BASS family
MKLNKKGVVRFTLFFLSGLLLQFLFFNSSLVADSKANEAVYKHLSSLAIEGNNEMIQRLNQDSRNLDWGEPKKLEFKGHLRFLDSAKQEGTEDQTQLFLVRRTDGEIFILSIPDRNNPDYQELPSMLENKMEFSINTQTLDVDGKAYQVAQFSEKPVQPILDKIFKLAIILMLFLVMVGMGLTLTGKDFAVLISHPKGIIIGEILQFGVMPLIAVGLGYLMGFHSSFPYIFVGMVLITATPGGVTSNLMTHYGKGDVALSVSLTSISTILSIVFLPLLLSAYCANIPDVEVPTKTISLTITVLVIVPLMIGMFVRKLNEKLALKLVPAFSALGIVALLFLIIAGILNNLEGFTDTDRHNVAFYTMVLLLTFIGMIIGGVVPKLFKVSNFQVRAISLETGLRNASLAMTIAILIQDAMGDFYSSMFWVSGMFGLVMYLAGLVSIKFYPKFFPVEES